MSTEVDQLGPRADARVRELGVVLNEQDLAQTQVFHKFSVWMRGLKKGHYRWQAGRQKPLASTPRRSFMLLRVFNK